MPWWLELLDAAGLVVLAVLLYGLALVVRRRVLSRGGGTFELSHRVHTGDAGRGWLLGLGRYSGEQLEWFRVFTLAPRPKRSWTRGELSFEGAREPEGMERNVLYPDHVVVSCQSADGEVELAMGRDSLTGFQAWLEARPPGTDWSR